jgi:hypothetical protein
VESIEKVDIEVDEDGIHLILAGDFVDTFTEYLTSTEHDEVKLRLPVSDAEALQKMLDNVLVRP